MFLLELFIWSIYFSLEGQYAKISLLITKKKIKNKILLVVRKYILSFFSGGRIFEL